MLWGNTYSTYIAKLQRLQNKATRIVFNYKYCCPITPHFCKLDVLKIADQYTFEVRKMMYQHSKQALPLCISSIFSPISSIHCRRTQSTSKAGVTRSSFLQSFLASIERKVAQFYVSLLRAPVGNFISQRCENENQSPESLAEF